MIHRLIMASSTTQIGGYDYEFVDTNLPDEFQCPICILVPRDVHRARCCGKMFCKSCLDELRRTSTNYTCPNCREPLTNNHFFKDVNTNRKICNLLIHCTNKRCLWKGSLQDIDKHLSTCDFQIVECSNKCGEQLIRIVLNSHIHNTCPKRIVSCVYCHKKDEYQVINSDHKNKECPDYPLPCPNSGCKQKIKRCLMTQHRTVCLHEMVMCSNGCGFECKRNEICEHLHNTCPKRIVSCPLCQSKGEHRSITGVHLTQCPDYPIPCPNNGCKENIKRCLMTQHRTVCLHEMVMCSNGCGFKFKRHQLPTHLLHCPNRIGYCPYCHLRGEHKSITGIHLTQCPDYPLPCPNNGCERKIKRHFVTQHRYTCPKEEVVCQYMYSYMLYECKQKIYRKHIHPHMIEHYKNEITVLRRINLVALVTVLLLSLQIPTILLMIYFTLVVILLFFNY